MNIAIAILCILLLISCLVMSAHLIVFMWVSHKTEPKYITYLLKDLDERVKRCN